MVEMLGIDIGHDRDRREQQQERRVALVGLGHHVLAAAQAHVGAARAQVAANRHGRIEPGFLQDESDERGGRGLAVRARDGYAQAHHAQQLAEHLGARDDWNLQRTRTRDFRIGKFHRR
jgi:hypothetical protein